MKIKIGNKTFEVSDKELEGNPKEITIETDNTIRTPDEESEFFKNTKKIGVKEGMEIPIKKYREAHNLEFEGKNIDSLVDAVTKKALEEAQIEPTEQLKKINQKLTDKETALQNALTAKEELENNFKGFKKGLKIDKEIYKDIPDNVLLPKEDMALIIKNRSQFDLTDDGYVGVKGLDGNFMTDKTTGNPVTAKDYLIDFFGTNKQYLRPITGGAGSGDSGSSNGKITIDQFIESQTEKGNNPNSEKFNAELEKAVKDGIVDV